MRDFRIQYILCGILAVSFATKIFADEPKSAISNAKWKRDGNKFSLIIDVSDQLTPAQREIINSGFSTFTLLAVSDNLITSEQTLPDIRAVCSVKYDTWEERYHIIRVEPTPVETRVIKDYTDWATQCLRLEISESDNSIKLKKGGYLHALLQIRQSSPDEAKKIKSWLVRQQSGFMQGLYSHMLGDFQFRDLIKIEVKIPLDQTTEKRDSKDKP